MSANDASRVNSIDGKSETTLGSNSAQRAPLGLSYSNEQSGTRRQTIGFPALRTDPKRVSFNPPLYATCMSLDEAWSMECQVLSVWHNGARLYVANPKELTEFLLLFTPPPRFVLRRCKRVWTLGTEIEVEFQRTQPSFALQSEGDR